MSYRPEKDMTHNYVSPDHRYACKDRPQPGEPWLQLEDKCGHSYKKSDPACTGCKWR
jgi:hypothetical protein